MAARTTVVIVGVIFAVTAVYLVISTILGLLIWVAIIAVLALAIVAAIKLTHRSAAKTVERERVTSRTAKGIVDCVGENLSIGDIVRAGTGFDGPMELAFSRGVIVKVGRGKAHVRFNDIPEQIHAVTPDTLRRLA
ncbi:MAG: hypothetical protein JWP48_3748 [Actinoallomurus sp.]|nr:hypothetical protein [Actinoallomurus sp.]